MVWSTIARNTSYYNYISQGTGAAVPGNAIANLNTTGLTILSTVTGVDDGFGIIPISFPFYFFGVDYGSNLNKIFWSTNNVLHFNIGTNTITWVATTGLGILLGNTDRRTNTFYYSTTQSSSGYNYINCVLYAQNIYNDGIPNAIQWQIRIFRGSSNQYIEVRSATVPNTGGVWNITNGSVFQNTFGGYTNVTSGNSFVLQSDINGNNWQFLNNYYVNI